ncbi:MAG: restriction endonuclease subunit S [Fibrobacter sp.]|nr:restriction endonuclease subunit S [Fibrobacter sp.]
MDGKQLKNSILQWAIQGKLVPQDPKDEPAQKLIEKIRKEKQELVKQGVLKKSSLEEIPVDEDGKIFDIPESWAWCNLSMIAETMLGKTKSPQKDKGKPQPYLCSINVYWEGIRLDTLKEMPFNDSEKVKYSVRKGDLLICEGGECGRAAIWEKDEEIFYQNALHRVRFYKGIDAHYFRWCLYLYKHAGWLNEHIKGETIKHLVQNELDSIVFPLPPLAEQKRIVAKLEKVLPLVDEYNAAQEQLDKLNKELPEALKKSILQQAIQGKLVPQNPKDEPAQKLLERIAASRNESSLSLPKGTSSTSLRGAKATKQSKNPPSRIYRENGVWYEQIGTATPKDISDEIPFEIPETWAWCRMGDIGSWGAGATPAKGNPAFYKNGEIPWLVTGELNNSVVTETKTKISKLALEKCSLRLCKPGDVLIAMYGATIGKIAIAGIELTTNQACCACTPHYEYNKYLFYFLMASKPDLIKRGEGGAQPNISKEKLVNYLMPLPPLAEQKRIVAKLEQLFKVL